MNTGRSFAACRAERGFSLVEVSLALGLVAFVLLALMGLFVVGLNSSRDSSMETAYAQIALRTSSRYPGTATADSTGTVTYQETYDYEGAPLPAGDPELYFAVEVVGKPSDGSVIAQTSTNLHLITLTITSPQNPGVSKVVHASAFVP